MSIWTRLTNIARRDQISHELSEEIDAHIDEAIAQGRDPDEARRAFGRTIQRREESHDIRVIPWLDALRADAIFGWRQLNKKKVTSAAAILSLGLAIGACTSAFRLIDALLFRPLPISEPERLYAISFQRVSHDGMPAIWDSCSYPMFLEWRAKVGGQADLLAASFSDRADVTFGADADMEKAYLQNVSGDMFRALGITPTVGRLLTADDDLKPGAHPYAVLSYDYWTRRFGKDPTIIGRDFRLGNTQYQVIGVAAEKFTGIEPGTVTEIFLPITMRSPATLASADSFWFRTLVRVKPDAAIQPLRDQLNASYRAFEQVRAEGHVNFSKQASGPTEQLMLDPAASGVSNMQRNYRTSLAALGVLVGLVLLISSANVANLMTAQAASRTREMALRVSIGAGRWRLIQLMLVESAWVASLASLIGGLFAWWSAPFVVRMINPANNPARLILPADWRVLGFGFALTLVVTLLFGLIPALQASSIKPANALKGGDHPHSHRRLMHGLIAVQTAFCFLVLFVAGLFVTSFDKLSNEPTGFSADRVLTLETLASGSPIPAYWNQVADHLRSIPGVEKVALAGWPLMTGEMRNTFVSVNGATPGPVLAFSLAVSPGWLDTMKIPFAAASSGRDFLPTDSSPGAAIVNETFARQYFQGENPVGRSFETVAGTPVRTRYEIVGLVRDARYRRLKEPMLPVAYVPLQPQGRASFIVRTSGRDPLRLATILRQEVTKARSEFRVSNIRTQTEIIQAQTIRERLLAMLAMFFAVVALLLAGVGLYGVLDYSVLQRRREIGIRMAIGAQAGDIARRVTGEVFLMVIVGALSGLGLGLAAVRSIESLFYQVKGTDLTALELPTVAIVAAALLAALPAVIRAVRIDPVKMLRVE